MKRTIRLMLASAGAVAVVSGGALGVAYATTPTAHPAQTAPSSTRPAVAEKSETPEATQTRTPEASEPTGTAAAENEASERAKDPTIRPTATGTRTPRADCSGTPGAEHTDGRDHRRPAADPSTTKTPHATPTAGWTRTHR